MPFDADDAVAFAGDDHRADGSAGDGGTFVARLVDVGLDDVAGLDERADGLGDGSLGQPGATGDIDARDGSVGHASPPARAPDIDRLVVRQ